MTKSNMVGAADANRRGAETGIEIPETGIAHSIVISCAKAIFPRKTWAYLAVLIDVPERTAKHRLAGSRSLSIDELRMLLRSDQGFEFLSALMEGAECRWWRQCRVMMRAVSARAQRARITRELHEAVDADRDLSAAINRAEAALAFQDEDFMRAHVDALGTMARLPDRTVAPTKRGHR